MRERGCRGGCAAAASLALVCGDSSDRGARRRTSMGWHPSRRFRQARHASCGSRHFRNPGSKTGLAYLNEARSLPRPSGKAPHEHRKKQRSFSGRLRDVRQGCLHRSFFYSCRFGEYVCCEPILFVPTFYQRARNSYSFHPRVICPLCARLSFPVQI